LEEELPIQSILPWMMPQPWTGPGQQRLPLCYVSLAGYSEILVSLVGRLANFPLFHCQIPGDGSCCFIDDEGRLLFQLSQGCLTLLAKES